jgi:HD-like signal output (HDOD) protein
MIDIDQVIDRAYELEPLPAHISRLAALISDDEIDLEEVESVVETDSALSARVLRAANAALSGDQRPASNIKEALPVLGAGTVLAIGVSIAARAHLQQSCPQYGMCEGELWEHSFASALAAGMAPTYAHAAIPPEAHASALLHDIGKQIIAKFIAPDVERILRMAQKDGGLTALQAESEVLGMHHGELGGLLAQHWRLPERMVRAVIHHHEPPAQADAVCDVVYLSNIVAKTACGHAMQNVDFELCDTVRNRLSLTPENQTRWCADLKEKIKTVDCAIQRCQSVMN